MQNVPNGRLSAESHRQEKTLGHIAVNKSARLNGDRREINREEFNVLY